MAEILRKKIDDHSVYAIWHITESVEELEPAISLRKGEAELYETFVAESRKKQWLAWRILVRRLLNPEDFPVEYDLCGKPYLAGSDYHISVTHSDDMAAVIISRRQAGIDLEKIRARVANVKDRFMSIKELSAISPERELEQMTLVWCAKEALYKFYGQRTLDFREQIHVEIPPRAGLPFSAGITFEDKHSRYRLQSEIVRDFVLVYLLE
jgi:phosphopantetheinyl transferase